MLTTDCLQVVVAVVASRWRYSWPRRGSCWFWCASRSRLHGHRYRQPAAGSETFLSSGRVWWSTSPADKRCTPVQQWCKLSETESCKVFTCTKSFQRVSHARCTPVRQAFRLAHAIYTDVQQAFRLSHVRYTHVQPAFRLSHARCTPVQQCNKLSEMELCSRCTPVQVFRLSHAPDVHLYNKLSDWVMLQMYTCTTSSQTESCSRCTPVQQAFRLSHAPDVHLYNKFLDWVMLQDVHLYNKFSDWVMLQMYTCTISLQKLGHARRTPIQQCNKLPEIESC